MRAVAENIYIEDQYPGVTLGAIALPHGLIQIDAPPAPEDNRAWRATLMNLGCGPERLLINLDAHPDRTLGSRAMECTIAASEKTAYIFRSRPTAFKAQNDETGAEWETIQGLGNVRWAVPEITFSVSMAVHWNDLSVILEHHPGPSAGACWVTIPTHKVVFVGDTVVRHQPPFLGAGDLPAWIDALKVLLSPAYRGYQVVAGRGGLATVEDIKAQVEFLQHVLSRLGKLAAKKALPDAAQNLAAGLLGSFKVPASRERQYTHRLQYGLHHYYLRHYHSINANSEEE
jgi:glyoxylase-like metal-dependent hydrolase (beta-lactamase superfamily II)